MQNRFLSWLTIGAVAGIVAAPCAQANIMFYDLFEVQSYSQASNNAAPTTPVGYNGFAVINASAGDLTGGNVTSTSPLSPMALTGSNGNYSFGIGVSTLAALQADFPDNAAYTFHVTGGTFNGQTAGLTTPAADAYSAAVPYLTGNSFNSLQGLNSTLTDSVTFDSYSTPAGVNTPLTFFQITRVSDNATVFSTSGSNTLTSVLLPANTLTPGTQYDLDVVFSSRLVIDNAGFGSATSFVAFDRRTDVLFTTESAAVASPEPSTILSAAIGTLLLVLCASIRMRRTA